MRLRIDELPEDGRFFELDMDTAWAVGAVSEAFEGTVHHLDGALRVRPIGQGVTVAGSAAVTVEQRCDRCLAAVRSSLEGRVDLYFDNTRLEGDANVGLHQDELDVGFLDDGELDLGAALGEFFLLEAPTRVRCQDPGVERAEPGACELASAQPDDEPDVDPRFAALKNFQAD